MALAEGESETLRVREPDAMGVPSGEGALEVILEAPVYVPFLRTRVELLADDRRITTTTIDRGQDAMLAGHDRRRLALQLLDLRRVTRSVPVAGEPASCVAVPRAA